jgi:protein-disulfide isomerase
MDKRFLGVLVAIVVVLIGVFAITNHKNASSPAGPSATLTNHVEGQGKSGVKLIEYGDYECPACYQYYPVVKQIYSKYSTQITFQFRNFPLTSLHKNAFAGARAAEAADLQGKFWQMHDVLYDNQDPNGQQGWVASNDPLSYFTQFATSLGLNVTKFKTDYVSSYVNDRINKDESEAFSLNFSGTPSFVLDGQPITNPAPTIDAFSKIIDKAIASKATAK